MIVFNPLLKKLYVKLQRIKYYTTWYTPADRYYLTIFAGNGFEIVMYMVITIYSLYRLTLPKHTENLPESTILIDTRYIYIYMRKCDDK